MLQDRRRIHRTAGNIGGELNLADWRFWKQTAKLKSANIYNILADFNTLADWRIIGGLANYIIVR